MSWYLEVWRKYADFSGRARRSEYWMFSLFNILVYAALLLLASIAIAIMGHGSDNPVAVFLILSPIWLYSLAILIPGFAVTIRRLHDTGRSGWFCLVSFIPFVGGILLLVFLCMESQPGPNLYGQNPKGVNVFNPERMPPYPQV